MTNLTRLAIFAIVGFGLVGFFAEGLLRIGGL